MSPVSSESNPCISKADPFIGSGANRERWSGYSVNGKWGPLWLRWVHWCYNNQHDGGLIKGSCVLTGKTTDARSQQLPQGYSTGSCPEVQLAALHPAWAWTALGPWRGCHHLSSSDLIRIIIGHFSTHLWWWKSITVSITHGPGSEARAPRIASHCNDAAPKSHPSSCKKHSPHRSVSICNSLWDIHAIDHLFAWINISLTLGRPPLIHPILFDKALLCHLYSGWWDHRHCLPLRWRMARRMIAL